MLPMEGRAYVGAYLSSCIPNSNDFDIAGDEKLALSLLPVQNQTGILIARHNVTESSESRYDLDLLLRFVVTEDANNTVRRSGHQQSLIVFIDEPRLVDTRAWRICVRKAIETIALLPIPDTSSRQLCVV